LGIRAYALVGFCIISLLFTQYAFAQFAECGPNEVRDITGECVSAFDDESSYSTLSVKTDRPSYNDGDTIRISGSVGTLSENPNADISLIIIDPSGEVVALAEAFPSSDGSYSSTLIAEGTMQISGDYIIIAQYVYQRATATFYFVGTTTLPPTSPLTSLPSEIVDTVPPLLLTPSDMTIYASDSSGALVDYSVRVVDDIDGPLRPNCSPSSGSLFPVGKTTVTCSATDNSGNSDRKSFLITVNLPDVINPGWIKDVAGLWCENKTDNASFIEAIQYLINDDGIMVPATASGDSGAQEIPFWIRSNACWWFHDLITNNDFASGLQYFIEQGILRV